MTSLIWLGLVFFFVVLEIGHPGLLYFLSLAFGALGALLATGYEHSFFVQACVFFAVTVVALVMLYWIVRRNMRAFKSHRSNVDQLLGRTVKITEVSSSTNGYGKVGGEVWLVKLQGSGELMVGMKVTVVGVQGCHLQVQIVDDMMLKG